MHEKYNYRNIFLKLFTLKMLIDNKKFMKKIQYRDKI